MTTSDKFEGFSSKTVKFFKELARHNSKALFEEHKPSYDSEVLSPSREFVLAMGERLKKIAPLVNADPKVNKSLFRIYRDVRFSKDKSPYKTHMGLWFWEGPGPRMECSGFYFQMEPPKVMLGVGIYCLPKFLLAPYRQARGRPQAGSGVGAGGQKGEKSGLQRGRAQIQEGAPGFRPGAPPRGALKA